jgi:putative transposon-encoded protein
MATHRIPILGWSTVPDTSGNVFFEPYTVKATNDVWGRFVVVFNDTSTRLGLRGGFTVPKNYVGGAKFVVVWTSTATSGDVEFDVDYRAVGGDDTESLDQTSNQESLNQNDTAPSAANERMEVSLTATAGNFAVDDEVEFELFRDGTDGGDTIAAAVMLFAVLFEYTD